MRSASVVLAVLLVACNRSPTEPGRNGTVTLQLGSASRVNDDLRVSFAELLEDSRCPKSVVCAWQGNGAVRLEITTGSGVQTVTLNTAGNAGFPRQATAAGYTFTLVELDPPRETKDPIPPAQYRATIRVTSAP